jgi:hypothetical protein
MMMMMMMMIIIIIIIIIIMCDAFKVASNMKILTSVGLRLSEPPGSVTGVEILTAAISSQERVSSLELVIQQDSIL